MKGKMQKSVALFVYSTYMYGTFSHNRYSADK